MSVTLAEMITLRQMVLAAMKNLVIMIILRLMSLATMTSIVLESLPQIG